MCCGARARRALALIVARARVVHSRSLWRARRCVSDAESGPDGEPRHRDCRAPANAPRPSCSSLSLQTRSVTQAELLRRRKDIGEYYTWRLTFEEDAAGQRMNAGWRTRPRAPRWDCVGVRGTPCVVCPSASQMSVCLCPSSRSSSPEWLTGTDAGGRSEDLIQSGYRRLEKAVGAKLAVTNGWKGLGSASEPPREVCGPRHRMALAYIHSTEHT